MHVHMLVKTPKSASLCVEIQENGEKKRIQLIRIYRWRGELAYKFFKFEPDGWSEDVIKAFVGMNALRIARDEWEARRYIKIIKEEMKKLELHFWFSKFITDRDKADKAWRDFYAR